MINHYEELVERIRGEVSDLDHLVQKALMAWETCKKPSSEQGIYMDSVALNLHGLYSGLERIFELIVRQVDKNMPAGDLWHRELLKLVSQDKGDIRPSVIGTESFYFLDELRRFRHLVRNVYTFNLVPEKVEPIILGLSGIWSKVKAEILSFADFLEQAGETEK
jgi:hypothetical protein